jgi:hypothetical protein
MGDYFVMSMRFNKHNASDFGLVSIDMNTATNPNDNSTWIKTNLYDFGWGKENGYYKKPLPDYPCLFEMTLHSKNQDDAYGAAAIILEQYPEELLIQCEQLMTDNTRKKEFKKIIEIFKLNKEMNRSPVLQKSYAQVQNDFERWKKVSNIANKI